MGSDVVQLTPIDPTSTFNSSVFPLRAKTLRRSPTYPRDNHLKRHGVIHVAAVHMSLRYTPLNRAIDPATPHTKCVHSTRKRHILSPMGLRDASQNLNELLKFFRRKEGFSLRLLLSPQSNKQQGLMNRAVSSPTLFAEVKVSRMAVFNDSAWR